MNVNFMSIGNEGIGESVCKGDTVFKGDTIGVVEYAKDADTGREDSVVGFITAEDGAGYLVSVAGHLVNGWRKIL